MPRRIAYAFAETPGGAVVASQSNIIDVFAHDGDASVEADLDTDTEGFWSFTFVPTGSVGAGWVLDVGPIYWTGVFGGRTRRGSSKSGGAVGPNSLLELSELWKSWGNGVIAGALAGDLAVTLDGAGMDCDIAAGCYNLDGQLVTLPLAKELTVTAADGTHPRIDRVILRRVRTAGDTEGKVTLLMKNGTAAASPVAPTLTADANTLEVSLAQVRSNAGVTTPTSVTDERTYTLTAVAKNPTLDTTVRTAPGATALTTTGTTIAALEQTPVLVSGVWYQVTVEGELIVDGASAVAMLAAFIDGTGNASDYQSAPAQSGLLTLGNVHSRRLLGAGAAITVGVLAKRSSAASVVNYYSGSTHVTAIPES